MCHTQPDRPRKVPRVDRGLRFSHATHAGKRECTGCHTLAKTSDAAADDLVPAMAACLSCHEHRRDMAEARCDRCHARPPVHGGMPRAGFFSHAGDFRRRHQDVARGRGDVCGSCHDQPFCLDCHAREAPAAPAAMLAERPDRARFHRGAFLERHAVEARAEPVSCLRCHGRTSCDSCHLDAGVSAVAKNAVSPHPVGWLVPGSPASHGVAAKRHLAECAGCHDQGAASNCVTCHRVGGSGPSPHGPGFTSPLERSDARVCRTCHAGEMR
jgi:hypothetical protein